ncbi:MAG: sulfatase-like hydrolase/transferase, partial [Rubripirellula sp.]
MLQFGYRVSLALLVSLSFICVRASAQKSDAGVKTPNIVLIMADDLGWKDLHCYGNEKLDTPNIDRLAQQGLIFTDAYSANPLCSPTRASILTGQYPVRYGLTAAAGHVKEIK